MDGKLLDRLIECVCIYEAFRRLGFTPDEILFVPVMEDGMMGMAVEAQHRRFVVAAGPSTVSLENDEVMRKDSEALAAAWKIVAEDYNNGRLENFAETFKNSTIMRNRHALIDTMVRKGFQFKKIT